VRGSIGVADDKLCSASGIDASDDEADLTKLRAPRPLRQPSSRSPAPAHLRRVDNPIAVPAGQRVCPKCGGLRVCVEPHVTEVIVACMNSRSTTSGR
jgi:hypothetical protein